MAGKLASSTSVLVFLLVAYGFAIGVGALVFVSGGFRSVLAFPALITMMFSPSLGAILAPTENELLSLPLGLPGLLALALIAILVLYDLRKGTKQ